MINTDLENALKIMIGSLEAEAIYVGNSLMWLSGPPYDAEIEYLESTGTLYIETGIIPNYQTKVLFKFMNLARTGDVIIGYDVGNDKTDWRFFNHNCEAFFDALNSSSSEGRRIIGGTINENTIYELELGNYYVKNLSTGSNIISGTAYTNETGIRGITLNHDEGHGTNSRNRWYYVKIYTDNTLVRDMIPVRIGQVGYMYDKISKQLFGNDGEGNFILGPDKGNYVTNGLIFHLDGIDKGTGEDWVDLVGGLQFTASSNNCVATENSWSFPGNIDDYLIYTGSLASIGGSDDFTIEVCYNELGSSSNSFVFGLGHDSDSKYPLFYSTGRYITWIQGGYTYDAAGINTGNTKYTASINNDRGIINGLFIVKRDSVDYWDTSHENFRIGSSPSGGASQHPLYGEVYSIRIYNRRLTESEQLHNQEIDNLRFNLGLIILQ